MVKITIMIMLLSVLSTDASASEHCAREMGGVCRDACAADEVNEAGAFEDCTEKQDCCVKKRTSLSKPTTPSGAVSPSAEGSAKSSSDSRRGKE